MTQTTVMASSRWSTLLRSLIVTALVLCAMVPVTAALAQTTPVDEKLEQALDQYLNNLQIEEHAAREELEGILAKIDESTPLSTHVRALSYLALVHQYNGDTDTAFAVNERMLALTENSGNADAEVEAIANRIELLQAQNKQAEAYLAVSDAEIALAQAQLPRVRFYVHNLISRIYADWGKYSDALEHLIAAQEAVNETNNDRTELRRQYLAFAIAQIQTDLAQWDDALATTNKAIADAQQYELLDELPDLYLLKSYIEVSLENYTAAAESLQLGSDWAERNDRPQIKLVSLNNLGDLYIRTNDLDRAESYLNRALEQALALDDELTEQMVRFNLGFIEVKQGNTESGLTTMQNGLEYFCEQGRKSDVEQILGELAEAYEIAGQYQQQAQALEAQREIRRELWQVEQQRNVTELQNLYDNKDKEQQIKILEQQNKLKQQVIEVNEQRQIIGLLLVIVVIFAGIFLWLMYRAARRSNLRLKEANTELAYQSLRDPLTGLWNRRALQQDMKKREQHGARRQQDQQQTDGLILLDIDFFKRINDKHGHAAGDTVLIEISNRLQTICRETDKLIRWGGEEFLFYLRDVDNDRMKILTARILEVISREPIMHEGKVIEVTTTAGFICLPFAGVDETLMDWEKVLQLADMALYTGKAHGRNRGVGITELHVPYSEAREVLETDLSAAVEKGWVTMITIEGQDSR